MHKLTSVELKQAIRDKFTFPGSYTLLGVTSDGAYLCTDCMRENFHLIVRDRLDAKHRYIHRSHQWNIIGIEASCDLEGKEFIEEHSEEYSLTICDHCNKVLND